jgi:cytochrome c biogenesis protein CcmG/thiol:disulfide interchange protein DsbE
VAEQDDNTQEERPANHRKLIAMAAVAIPLIALFAILGVALGRSGGVPAGIAINSAFGEVDVDPDMARDFVVTTFDGEELRLSDLRGQVVMLDFWASWCSPCRQEAPVLSAAYADYKAQGVEFLGVAIWDIESEAKRFALESGAAYPMGVDTKGNIAIDYGLTGIPEKYFIDAEGRIVRKFVGPVSDDILERVFSELLSR